MSDVVKDISNIWDRLFDHKGFLSGEINFTLTEFEQKRGDREVDHLFATIESLTDIKDTQINQLKEGVNESIIECNRELSEALQLCGEFSKLRQKIDQNALLEDSKNKRKVAWQKFMDKVTSEYFKINTDFEEQESHLKSFYDDLERKLI